MKVTLCNYGQFVELLGGFKVELELAEPTLGGLFSAVRDRFGTDLASSRNLRLVIGAKVLHEFPRGFRLEEGQEVKVVPIVVGG